MAAVPKAVVKESFDGTLSPEHGGAVAAATAVAALFVVSLVGSFVFTRRVRFAHLLVTFLWCATTTTGLVVWGVTYDAMREALEEQTELMLKGKLNEVASEVTRLLEAGPLISEVLNQLHVQEVATLNATYPTPINTTVALTTAFLNHTGVAIVYYGNRYEYTWGVVRSPRNKLMMGMRREDWENPNLLGEQYVCLQRDVRTDCSPAACAGTVASDWECSTTCGVANRTNCYEGKTGPGILYTPFLEDEVDPTHWLDWAAPAYRSGNYNPTSRPWFQEAGDYHSWTDPYVFDGGEVGISATRGVRDPAEPSKLLGVIAVDFTIVSLHNLMLRLPLTPNAVVLLATVKGVLLAGNVPKELLTPVKPGEYTRSGAPKYGVAYVANSAPLVKRPFAAIERRFGTLRRAFDENEILLLHEDRTIIAVHSLTVPGGLETLVVVAVPYSDVLSKGDEASTRALVIAIAVSVACGLLVGLTVVRSLRPLHRLLSGMEQVAWMHLEGVEGEDYASAVLELDIMSLAFSRMVGNLRSFQEYLPASLRKQDEADETEVSVSASRSTSSSARASVSRTSASSCARAQKKMFVVSLERRKVAMLCLNQHGSHERLAQNRDKFLQHYAEYLDKVSFVSRKTSGVVDSFSGDRVMLSFNAVNSVPSATAKACDAALSLSENEDVRVGVAVGPAECGNSGGQGSKRFNVFSPVVQRASLLCDASQTEDFPKRVHVVQDVAKEAGSRFVFRFQRVVQFPQKKAQGIIVASLEGVMVQDEEWMYAMDKDLSSGANAYNICFAHFVHGRVDEATEASKNLQEADRQELMTRFGSGKEQLRQFKVYCAVTASLPDILKQPKEAAKDA